MVIIALCSLLIGAALGTRLKVYALFPGTILGVVIIAVVAAAKGLPLGFAASAAIVWIICLQFGYVGCVLICTWLNAAAASNDVAFRGAPQLVAKLLARSRASRLVRAQRGLD
jgi:ABC-type amino acid transport system permease subunit